MTDTAQGLQGLIDARDALRAKAVSFGIALASDKLDALAEAYGGIVDRGTVSAQVKEGESYTVQPGFYKGGSVSGVAGGGNYALQAKGPITPTNVEQTIVPDSGYYGLSSVKIGAAAAAPTYTRAESTKF